VILNKATSLVVVATALPFRASTVPFAAVGVSWPVIVNLLAGSLAGAWVGAGWATRLKSETLYRIIATDRSHPASRTRHRSRIAAFHGAALVVAGIIAGFVIGVIASLLGVAGEEFLIPTLVLLFGADVKLAGSLSLADDSFSVIGRNKLFLLMMAAGSIVGTFVGGQMLGCRTQSWCPSSPSYCSCLRSKSGGTNNVDLPKYGRGLRHKSLP
jgi:uncharacterized membrane protein YfcA